MGRHATFRGRSLLLEQPFVPLRHPTRAGMTPWVTERTHEMRPKDHPRVRPKHISNSQKHFQVQITSLSL